MSMLNQALVYNGVRKQFVATPFTKVFTDYMHYRYNQIGNAYTNDDYTRLVIKIHLAMHPEERATFEVNLIISFMIKLVYL